VRLQSSNPVQKSLIELALSCDSVLKFEVDLGVEMTEVMVLFVKGLSEKFLVR
jgi:hypothetical protein